jgi:hypothetical protein
MAPLRPALLALSFLGLLLFGGALVLSFLDPLLVERAMREVVRVEVGQRVGARIEALTDSRIADLGRRALQDVGADIAQTQQALRDDVPRKVAEVVADMLDADCACRQRLVELERQAYGERLDSLVAVRGRLHGLVEAAYATVARDLLREFRIFTATNAIAFALLLLVALVRRRAALQLLLPALVLAVATVASACLYVFGQDWLHAIVFGDYVGWAYASYLVVVALLIADVALNRARVTTRLVNLALDAVGSAFVAVPC